MQDLIKVLTSSSQSIVKNFEEGTKSILESIMSEFGIDHVLSPDPSLESSYQWLLSPPSFFAHGLKGVYLQLLPSGKMQAKYVERSSVLHSFPPPEFNTSKNSLYEYIITDAQGAEKLILELKDWFGRSE